MDSGIASHQIAPQWSMAVGDLGRFLVLFAVACFALAGIGWAFSGGSPKARRAAALLFPAALAAYAIPTGISVLQEFYYKAFAVVGALTIGMLAALGSMALVRDRWKQKVPAWAFTAGTVALFGTVVCLGALFVGDQFHYTYVHNRASVSTDLKYKIAGIWAGQEGSFLLWATMSAVFGLLGARVAGAYRRWYTVAFAFFLMAICAIVAYESPFHVHPEAWAAIRELKAQGFVASAALPFLPADGNGLTPSLQNYWVVIHPPTIFAGFGSLALLFAFAVSAMLTGNAKDWVRIVRPWTLISLAVLGLGLCMGGFWAYETLGWGGFWAWDPVENVSFVPWCFVAALVHGLIVQATKGRWITTNLLLGGLPFLLFVYGTFMTRSGFLEDSSVHSFAEMDRTALWLLIGFLVISVVGFAALWFTRGFKLGADAPEGTVQGLHREGAYRWGSLMLCALGIATAVGMSVPLIQSILGDKPKAVNEHSYHLILVWFFVPILLLIAAGPFIGWRGMSLSKLLGKLLNVFSMSLFVVGICFFIAKRSEWSSIGDPKAGIAFPFGLKIQLFPWMLFLVWLCAFTFFANLWRIAEIWKRGRTSVGAFISHIGVAVLMAGLIISRGFEQNSGEDPVFVDATTPAEALGYTIAYKGRKIPIDSDSDLTNRDNQIIFTVTGRGESFEARPGHYYLESVNKDGEREQQAWPYIHHSLWHDIYFTLFKELTSLGKPFTILPGGTHEVGGLKITYKDLKMQGEPGKAGTKLVADLSGLDEHGQPFTARPSLMITDHGPESQFATLPDGQSITMLRMDATTRSAEFQLFLTRPVYPIKIFYKPMAILVWIGAGILTLGGLLSAWYRRRPGSLAPMPEDEPVSAVEKIEDASTPTA